MFDNDGWHKCEWWLKAVCGFSSLLQQFAAFGWVNALLDNIPVGQLKLLSTSLAGEYRILEAVSDFQQAVGVFQG